MTDLDIQNLALSRLGEPRISSPLSSSPAADAIRGSFVFVRDSLLRSHPWNFVTVRTELTEGAVPAFGWSHSYPLPLDFLRLLSFNEIASSDAGYLERYTIEGTDILSNDSEAKIIYTRQVTDPSEFEPSFIEALSYKLASAVCVAITGSDSRTSSLEAGAEQAIQRAGMIDSNESKKVSHRKPSKLLLSRMSKDDFINPPFQE